MITRTTTLLFSFVLAGTAFGQETRDPARFNSLGDTILENCIIVAGNQVAPLRNDGTFQVNGVPASRGAIRALVQCAYPEGNFGRWTDPVEPVTNATLQVPTLVGALGALPPLPVRLVATPTIAQLIAGGTLQLNVSATGPAGESTDVTGDAVFRSGNPGVVTLGPAGQLTAVGVGTAMIGVVFAGRVTVVPVTVVEDPDRDGDGLPNAWEEERGLDADLAKDAFFDLDGDGLTTREEFELGTEYDRADTDDDGLSDGQEVAYGTDPLRYDTDLDGIGDGTDNCPLDQNPDQADANGDLRGDACPGPCGSSADCDDGNVCSSDVCGTDGKCTTSPISGCCTVDADCQDDDVCTANACGPDGTCITSPVSGCCNADTDCNDGAACTRDQCDLSSHACLLLPITGCCQSNQDCADTNTCTADTCDTATGVCARSAIPNCCVNNGDCADTDSCTTDTCSGGSCVHVAISGCCHNATECNDGMFCNGTESCGGVRGCLPGVAPCSDGFGCTVDACQEATDACTFTPMDSLCDDQLFCNGTETCVALTGCQAGEPINCDDGISCTVDSCVEGTGCDQVPNDALCNNGSDCDGREICDVNLGCMANTAPLVCDDPILEYHFDEALGPTAIDSSGLGRHGTLVNGSAWVGGISATALDFDGINDWVQPSQNLSAPGEWSISAFIFDTGGSGRGRGIVHFESDFDPIRFGIGPDRRLQIIGACAGAGSAPVPEHRWTHVTVTYDGANASYYVDGALVGTVACAPFTWSRFGVAGTAMSDDTTSFRGRIDELEVYSRALTAAQIADRANALSLHFDEGSGTGAIDTGALEYHGMIMGAAWTPTGFLRSALDFDGISDLVTIPGFGSVDMGEGLAIDLRVMRARAGVRETLVALGDPGDPGGFELYFEADDSLVFALGGVGPVIVGNVPIDDADWHRVELHNRGGTYQLYVDGALDLTETNQPPLVPGPLSSDLTIGATSDLSNPFEGTIDEVRIRPSANFNSDVVFSLAFDEGSGTTANDRSANTLHGTLLGETTFTTGLSGTAVHFAGRGGQVDVPFDGPAPTAWSMMTWIFDERAEGAYRTIAGVYAQDGNRALWLNPSNILHFNPCAAGSRPIPANRWVHVAVTFEGGTLRYYIDGALDRVVGCGAQPINNFTIGSSPGLAYPFQGTIDHFDFRNRAVTPEEVADAAKVVSFHFDTIRRSRIDDSSGLANQGRMERAAWIAGLPGYALDLNGTDSVVTVPNSSSLNLTDGLTVQLLFRRSLSSFGSAETLVAKSDNSTAGGWRLYVDADDRLAFEVTGLGDVIVGRTSIRDGLWHRVALTRAGETLRLLLDGREDARQSVIYTPVATPLPLTLGIDSAGRDPMDGAIDEFFIAPVPVDPAVAARYRFDEPSGTTANDASGNRYTATLNGVNRVVDRTGSAIDFPNAGVVTTTYPSILGAPPVWTFEAWIYDRSGPGTYRTIWGVYTADDNRALWLDPNNILHFNPCAAGSVVLPSNRWVHVAVTFDGGTTRYYVNGELDRAVGCGAQPINTFRLGRGNGAVYQFNGMMDQVSFHREVRSASQIRGDAGLVTLHFDEGVREVASDASGLLHHGTLSTGVFWSTGPSGSAVDFDGATGVIAIPDAPEFGFETGWSIRLFARRNVLGLDQTLIAKSDGTPGGWRLHINETNQVAFEIVGQGDVVISERIDDLQWHQIDIVQEGELYLLHIDGVESARRSSFLLPSPPAVPLTIGADALLGAPLDGSVDEVQIVPFDRPNSPLIARFRMEEGTGTTLFDSSGNGYHATIDAAAWAPGQFGNGLDFSAGAQVVANYQRTRPTPAQWSFEAWIFDRSGPNVNAYRTIWNVYTQDGNRSLWLNPANRLHFNPCAAGNANVPHNQWVHVAITYDGGTLRYYLNGALDAEVGCGPQPINGFYVGESVANNYAFNGWIDQVSFWEETRSAAQIREDASLAVLHLDELARVEAVDESGLLNHGQLTSGAAWSAGFSGGGVLLQGTTGGITIADSDSIRFLDHFSIQMRFSRGLLRGAARVLAAQSDGSTAGGWRFYIAPDERLRFAIDGVGDVLSGVRPINDSLWHQVALSKKGETYSLWIDGTLDAVSQSFESPASGGIPVTIGARGDGAQVYDGVIDDVRLLPIAEPDSTLEMRLRFDEGSGTTAFDTSGNAFHSTLIGTAAFGPGQHGTGLVLDGTGTSGVVTPYPGTAYPAPPAWTLEAWIFNTNTGVYRSIFNVYPNDANRSLWINPSNRLHFNPCAQGSAVVPANQWVHVAITYDGSVLRYYLNGNLDAAVGCGPQPIGGIRVGSGVGDNYPFAGMIDEAFFFSEARTAQEIALDMTVP